MLSTYYNEIDPYAAQWLRNLIDAGLIAPGDVDERSIAEVQPADLRGYVRCHFFAGIAGWDLALHLAGWSSDRSVWTGSCPCQPFSAAGKRRGTADERHLWPEFHRLIRECQPATVFGEQVASKDGRQWLAGVRADLEDLGYAVGAADLCAAGQGAPHIRQRLWWVADAQQRGRQSGPVRSVAPTAAILTANGVSCVGGLGHAEGFERGLSAGRPNGAHDPESERASEIGRLGDAQGDGRGQGCAVRGRSNSGKFAAAWPGSLHPGENFWSAYDLVPCRDGRARRVEPGTFPLAHGVPARVGKLRAYGNAISPQVAAQFIRSFIETV